MLVNRTLVLALFALAAAAPSVGRADFQASARLGFGLGGAIGARAQPGLLIETVLRSELLFGAPGDEHFRVGPALDLRSQRFRTFEAAAGVAVLLPVARGFPIVLTLGAGYAFRDEDARKDSFFLGTLAWGYRSYNFHSRYGYGLQVYVSSRLDTDAGAVEITGGVEIDFGIVVLPAIMAVQGMRRGDPDELGDDPEANDE